MANTLNKQKRTEFPTHALITIVPYLRVFDSSFVNFSLHMRNGHKNISGPWNRMDGWMTEREGNAKLAIHTTHRPQPPTLSVKPKQQNKNCLSLSAHTDT